MDGKVVGAAAVELLTQQKNLAMVLQDLQCLTMS